MHSVESAYYSLTTLKSRTPTLMSSQYTTSQSAPVSKARLQELRQVTQSDPTLHGLTKTVQEGWPQSKKDFPEQLLDFWSFRQEISKEDGLLYKNQRLIVPHSERLETLKVLHLGYHAVDKMQLRALETVYWPGINRHSQTIPELKDLHQAL